MAIYHNGLALVVEGPVLAYRESPFVGLATGLAVEGELRYPSGGAALVAFQQACVGYDEASVVEEVVFGEALDELARVVFELVAASLELVEGLLESMRDLDGVAFEAAEELVLVVAGDAEGCAGLGHVDSQLKDLVGGGPAVDQVSQEDCLAAGGVGGDPVLVLVTQLVE